MFDLSNSGNAHERSRQRIEPWQRIPNIDQLSQLNKQFKSHLYSVLPANIFAERGQVFKDFCQRTKPADKKLHINLKGAKRTKNSGELLIETRIAKSTDGVISVPSNVSRRKERFNSTMARGANKDASRVNGMSVYAWMVTLDFVASPAVRRSESLPF